MSAIVCRLTVHHGTPLIEVLQQYGDRATVWTVIRDDAQRFKSHADAADVAQHHAAHGAFAVVLPPHQRPTTTTPPS